MATTPESKILDYNKIIIIIRVKIERERRYWSASEWDRSAWKCSVDNMKPMVAWTKWVALYKVSR